MEHTSLSQGTSTYPKSVNKHFIVNCVVAIHTHKNLLQKGILQRLHNFALFKIMFQMLFRAGIKAILIS